MRRDTGGLDFGGPYVRGDRSDRNLFLAWGDVPGDGTLRLVRGSNLRLADVDPRLVEEAMRPGHRLVARIRLTSTRRNPPAPGGLDQLARTLARAIWLPGGPVLGGMLAGAVEPQVSH